MLCEIMYITIVYCVNFYVKYIIILYDSVSPILRVYSS